MRSVDVFTAMACAVSPGQAGVWRRWSMVKMGCHAFWMGVSSYDFCSMLPLLHLLHLSSRHAGRHRITGPAAQRQQGDHEDEEQVAHGEIRGWATLKVHFIARLSNTLKPCAICRKTWTFSKPSLKTYFFKIKPRSKKRKTRRPL